MEREDREIFKRSIENILQFDEGFDPENLESPRTLLMIAMNKLSGIKGQKLDETVAELSREFMTILKELSVNTEDISLLNSKETASEKSWAKRKDIRRDAWHHQIIQPPDTYK